jgi:hypothetical protein
LVPEVSWWQSYFCTNCASSSSRALASRNSAQPFREPAADRREQIAGFGALTLIAPEAGEAGGGTQLKKPGTLLPSHSERAAITIVCRIVLTY